MVVIGAFMLVLLAGSVHGFRTAGRGPRWPFLVSSILSGGGAVAVLTATVIALSAGREAWNNWVSGSQLSEAVTLWLVLIAGPLLLATCCALLIIGAVLRTRHQRRSEETPSR